MYGFRGDPDSGAVAYRVVASRRGDRGREVSSSTRTPQSPPTRLARAQAEGRIRSWSHGHAPRWGDGDLDAGVAIRAASPGGTSASPSRPDRRLLRIEVTDTRGDDLPCHRPMSPDTESGRGLLLVEALADRWGVELGPAPRKTVWVELDLAPHAPKPEDVCSGGLGALPKGPRGGKKPHQASPSRPRRPLTRASEHHQLGWLGDRLAALRSARHNTTADMRRPPPGRQSQCEGLTTEEESPS